MRANDEFWFGVPLVVRNVESGLQPNPLLALGKKPVEARGAFAFGHERFVTVDDSFQIVRVVIIVTGCAQQFERQVADYWRRSVV